MLTLHCNGIVLQLQQIDGLQLASVVDESFRTSVRGTLDFTGLVRQPSGASAETLRSRLMEPGRGLLLIDGDRVLLEARPGTAKAVRVMEVPVDGSADSLIRITLDEAMVEGTWANHLMHAVPAPAHAIGDALDGLNNKFTRAEIAPAYTAGWKHSYWIQAFGTRHCSNSDLTDAVASLAARIGKRLGLRAGQSPEVLTYTSDLVGRTMRALVAFGPVAASAA